MDLNENNGKSSSISCPIKQRAPTAVAVHGVTGAKCAKASHLGKISRYDRLCTTSPADASRTGGAQVWAALEDRTPFRLAF